MSKLSDNMHYLRLMHKYSISELARILGYAPNTISNWERGDISPNADAVQKLCELYKISPNQIFGWDLDPELVEFISDQGLLLDEMEDLKRQKAEIAKRLKEYNKRLGCRK